MGSVNNRPFGVVTGGSSGIGFELARQFVLNGFDVMIVADEPGVFEAAHRLETDGASIYPQQQDLSTYEGCENLWGAIQNVGRPVEAIALNAGVGVGGEFLKTDLNDELKMIHLNADAVVHLAKRVVPGMVAAHKGRVLITSSIAGTMPAPYEATYGATKAFDLSFAEALRYELKETGVTVTALQPGPTETEFFERAGLADTKVGQNDKDDPAKVAQQGFEAMMKGKDKVIAGSLKTRVEGLANEVLPEEFKAKRHAKLAEPGSGQKQK